MIPPTNKIEQVMAETGMAEMQAINHLRCRALLERRKEKRFVPFDRRGG